MTISTFDGKYFSNPETGTAFFWSKRNNVLLSLVDNCKRSWPNDIEQRGALARGLEEWFDQNRPDVSGVWSDLLTRALARVEWWEVSGTLLGHGSQSQAEEGSGRAYRAHEGWSNIETWSVNLWLANDEGLYKQTLELVAKHHGNMNELELKEFVGKMRPNLSGVWDAMLTQAERNVIWPEIATAWNARLEEAIQHNKNQRGPMRR